MRMLNTNMVTRLVFGVALLILTVPLYAQHDEQVAMP